MEMHHIRPALFLTPRRSGKAKSPGARGERGIEDSRSPRRRSSTPKASVRVIGAIDIIILRRRAITALRSIIEAGFRSNRHRAHGERRAMASEQRGASRRCSRADGGRSSPRRMRYYGFDIERRVSAASADARAPLSQQASARVSRKSNAAIIGMRIIDR